MPAGGTRVPVPECPDLVPDTSSSADAGADIGLDGCRCRAVGLLAEREPVWHKLRERADGLRPGAHRNELTPDELDDRASIALTVLLPAGLGENADNKYVSADLSQEFGQVALITRARCRPRRKTLDGQRRMGGGQLRFWSMCTGSAPP